MDINALKFLNLLKRVPPKADGTCEVWITFSVTHQDLIMSQFLRDKYYDYMTIVLENDYELIRYEFYMEVWLRFDGVQHMFSIPYEAITTADFEKLPDLPTNQNNGGKGGNVVSIIDFRNK